MKALFLKSNLYVQTWKDLQTYFIEKCYRTMQVLCIKAYMCFHLCTYTCKRMGRILNTSNAVKSLSLWKEVGMKVTWEGRGCSSLTLFADVCIVWIFCETIFFYDLHILFYFILFYFIYFLSCTHRMCKFLDQGSNLHHSSDNTRSLTCWATRELPDQCILESHKRKQWRAHGVFSWTQITRNCLHCRNNLPR